MAPLAMIPALVGGVAAATSTATTTENIVIFGPRPTPVPWLDDRTAAVQSIPLDDRLAVNESLGDVLSEAAGVRVQRSGGEGAFEGLSIRGSEPDHTVILIGDIPIAGTDRGAVDLSMLPVQAFERVEVFRGGAPAWLDQGQIGGVVRLLPRLGDRDYARAEAGTGSFGGYWGRAEAGLSGASSGAILAATARTRDNEYRFFDDRGTNANPDDDRFSRRQNADSTQVHGFAHAYHEWSSHRLQALALAVFRRQGEPGIGHRQAREARRNRSQVLGTLAYDYRADRWRVQAVGSVGWDRDAFEDPLGEVGLGQEDTQDQYIGLQGRLAGQWDITKGLELTIVSAVRHDRYAPDDVFGSLGNQPSSRTTGGGVLEARGYAQWGRWAFEARPSVAYRWSQARLVDGNRGVGPIEIRSVSEGLPTFRLGLFVSPRPWLAVQGSAWSGRRLPTVLELFGNRGNLVANPGLRPERALAGDLGVLVRGRTRLGRRPVVARLEARGFVSQIDDLIRYRRTSQFVAIAENVDAGRLFGLEMTTRLALPPWIWLDGQLAWLDARDDRDRELPLRPRWTGRAQAEVRAGALAAGWADDMRARVDWSYVGASRPDPANLITIQPRGAWGAALETRHGGDRLRVVVAVRDLFDAGGSDLLGFPLPGRRVDVAVSWTETFE